MADGAAINRLGLGCLVWLGISVERVRASGISIYLYICIYIYILTPPQMEYATSKN